MKSHSSSIAMVRFDETLSSLRKTIELCNGFEKLSKEGKVLLKPNILWGGRSKHLPKYGAVTTSRIVEDLIQLLLEHGCKDISIGEGTVVNDELGSNTFQGFKWSGIERIAKKYGVKLVDFNQESFERVELDGARVRLSTAALETDFLINIPVLKTHYQTKVSLGMKNLKGCLHLKSKMDFHRKGLEHFIALLNTQIRPALTIIDGICAMERGPDFAGQAHRSNLLIAGQDPLSCDIVGSTVLGIEPSTVGHLREFALLENRPLDLNTIDLRGEDIENVTKRLEWDRGNWEEMFHDADIEGVMFQGPGKGFCSGCLVPVEASLALFLKDNKGMAFDNIEICSGPETKPKDESKKILLVGDCSIRANKDHKGAITVEGCPPTMGDTFMTLTKNALDKQRARKIMTVRLFKKIADKMRIYDENLIPQKHYPPPEFNENHF